MGINPTKRTSEILSKSDQILRLKRSENLTTKRKNNFNYEREIACLQAIFFFFSNLSTYLFFDKNIDIIK